MSTPRGIRLPWSGAAAIAAGRRLFPQCLWEVATSESRIALTFDDGPSVAFLPGLLETLERHRLRATFFIVGDRFGGAGNEKRRELVRRLVASGHEIGFHGWHHEAVWRKSEKELSDDITRFRQALQALAGDEAAAKVRFFRPPFGLVAKRTVEVFEKHRFRVVQASILPGDTWKFPDYYLEVPERAVPRILKRARPGAILCLHVGEDIGRGDSVYDATHVVEIVEAIIPKLRAMGFEILPMGEV